MKIYQNAIMVREDGKILHSIHRHDYLTHKSPSGKEFMIDGGRDYFRYSYDEEDIIPLYITDESSEQEIVDRMLWGTRGVKGDQPLTWIRLKDAETDHLKAILKNATPGPHVVKAINTILSSRETKPATKELVALSGKEIEAIRPKVKAIGKYIIVPSTGPNKSASLPYGRLFHAKLYYRNNKIVYYNPTTESEHLVSESNHTFYKI